MNNQEASLINRPVGVQRVFGDASDTFSFASFFPDALQRPLIIPLSDIMYQIFCRLGLLVPFNEEDVIQSNDRAMKRASNGLGRVGESRGSEASIAERRRQIALQAIEERISTD